MVLSWRFCSSADVDHVAHRAQPRPALDQVGVDAARRGRAGRAPCAPTARASPGRPRHSSSIVTDRIGASRRARPSTTMNIAVWPERRALGRGAEGVHPVLGDVDVERAHVHGDELVGRLEDRRVVVVVVGLHDARGARRRTAPASSGRSPPCRADRHRVVGRVEVVEVRHQHAQHVADLPVGLDGARQDLLADADVLAVVDHRRPQPQRSRRRSA